jgi:hypothetical protein
MHSRSVAAYSLPCSCSHPSPRERAGVVGRGERLPHLRTERTSGLLAAAFEEFDAPESQYDRLGVDV